MLSPLRRQALILLVSLAGVLVGAALVARWALGVAVIADSVFGIWYALMSDVADPVRADAQAPTLEHVFDAARRAR